MRAVVDILIFILVVPVPGLLDFRAMSAQPDVPDAWDDDWESQADVCEIWVIDSSVCHCCFFFGLCKSHSDRRTIQKLANHSTPPSEKKVSSKVTKAQRRAQQAEFNRQLWAEAYAIPFAINDFKIDELSTSRSESPQTFHYVEARSDVPLKQDFKPAVTLLSRKPQITTRQSSSVAGIGGATVGVGQLGLNGEEDDSDEDSNKPSEPTPEERQAIALKNLEEKQRKYEEVRERLFGSPSATTSGNSSPGSTTPPRQIQSSEGRGKGKGRGRDYREKRDSSTASGKSRNLYDPGSPAKAGVPPHLPRRERQGDRSDSENQFAPQQPSRSPRGPDASGRGGFRFGNRGARAS